jgi:CheY-like chemotaxis protein
VADDNATCRDIVVSILEAIGCQVDTVADGEAAAVAARETRYDLIFLDGVMPHMDGIETALAIRRLPGMNGQVPIVGVTGDPVRYPKARCLDAGMNEYLQKPVGRDEYRQAVARWMQPRGEPARARR